MDFDWRRQLYERKAAELILYGRALGLSHGEAEDVLQETFLALMQMAECPREREHYCIRSFRNRALNHRRSLWRRLTRELESLRWFEKSPGESPAERAAMRCLAELPVEQREVIVLKIWHRATFEEIGGLLEISPNTAAGRYRYGLQKIKFRLEETDYDRERNEIHWRTNCTRGGRAVRRRRLSGGCFCRPSRNTTARWLGWLTPAAACVWLAVLSLDSGNGISSPGRRAPMIAMISSNPICVTFWQGFAERGENAPIPAIFKWTNTGSSTSTIGFAPIPKDN